MICPNCGVNKESTLANIKVLLKERDDFRDRTEQLEAETETKIDGPCIEGDGCPTEIAILKREWRQLKAENKRLCEQVKALQELKQA